MESVKKCSNSDLVAAITNIDEADVKLVQSRKIRIVNDMNVQAVRLSEEEYIENYPLTYNDVWQTCKLKREDFKKDKQFDSIMKKLKKKSNLCYERKTNPKSEKSLTTCFYSKEIIEEVLKLYR